MQRQGNLVTWLMLGLLAIGCLPGYLPAQAVQEKAPPPKTAPEPIHEFWEAVYLENQHVGFGHGVYRPLPGNLISSAEEIQMSLSRFGSILKMDFNFTMIETKSGDVKQFAIRQSMGQGEELVRKGVVEKGQVRIDIVQGNQKPINKLDPWNHDALGLYAMEKLYEGKELKPGLEFDFKNFSPEFNSVLNFHVVVGDKKPTQLLDGRNVAFWRVSVKLQKIGEIQLPPMICWVNDQGEVYKREQEIAGMGHLTFFRTRKERAKPTTNAVVAGNDKDIGYSQLIRLNRSFNNFNQTRNVVYRVQLKDFEGIEKAFANEPRQVVKVNNAGELEITSKRMSPPPDGGTAAKLPPEYLRNSHFIDCEDPTVKQHARQATANASTPWVKALAIENWIHRRMTNKNYGKAFATATETARTLDGDCSEHAVLATAMCRAVGIPSRTAIGLIHVPSERAMCFHMWFEVWINGQWYSLDGTLGQGHIAGGHVKVLDAHWNDTDSYLPLLPVTRLLGKLKMDVLSVEYEAGVPPR